jgi:hypothetical protein
MRKRASGAHMRSQAGKHGAVEWDVRNDGELEVRPKKGEDEWSMQEEKGKASRNESSVGAFFYLAGRPTALGPVPVKFGCHFAQAGT